MSRRGRPLWLRLALSYLLVTAVGAVVLLATVRLLVPRLFDDRVGSGGPGGGPPPQAGRFRDIVLSSLNRALVVAAIATLVAGGAMAWVLARRIVRPLDGVRATTRALAQGELHVRVDRPDDAELGALADDVNVLAEHLEHTEQRRRQLVTDLGHELRTPITTIKGYVEGFQDGVMAPSPEALAELADEVRRLERLTDDLGLLSRLDEGQVRLDLAPVDLGPLAAQVVARLGPQFDASSIEVTTGGVPGLTVTADRDRLLQILTNLVGNALRYTESGGHVDVHWGRDGDVAWCAVSDDGVGIPADELTAVFDRFVRGRSAEGVAGSGVGLTIARSLARVHGGDVVVASDGAGKGAIFTLRLPIA